MLWKNQEGPHRAGISVSFCPRPTCNSCGCEATRAAPWLIRIRWTVNPGVLPAAQIAIKLKENCQSLRLSASEFYIPGAWGSEAMNQQESGERIRMELGILNLGSSESKVIHSW